MTVSNLVGADTRGVAASGSGSVVGIPGIEPTWEASVPALVALREAVETLQGVRDGPGGGLEPVTGVQPILAAGCELTDQAAVGAAQTALPGLQLPVKGGRTYAVEFILAIRQRAGAPDLALGMLRPSGPFTASWITGSAMA